MEEELQKTPMYRALTRPILLFGADRRLVLLIGLVCGTLVYMIFSWIACALGMISWLVSFPILRNMAKKDPLMVDIYRRHISYDAYYRAYPTPWSRQKKKLPWNSQKSRLPW
jgi:type IV secretion system protein VirB3